MLYLNSKELWSEWFHEFFVLQWVEVLMKLGTLIVWVIILQPFQHIQRARVVLTWCKHCDLDSFPDVLDSDSLCPRLPWFICHWVLREQALEAIEPPVADVPYWSWLVVKTIEELMLWPTSVLGADRLVEVITNDGQVLLPVRPLICVNPVALELIETFLEVSFGLRFFLGVEDDAWGESDELSNTCSYCRILVRKLSEHLRCTLPVADVKELLNSSQVQNLIHHGRNILISHFLPAEIPVFCVSGRVQESVSLTVLGASTVSHPDIVAFVGQLKHPGDDVFILLVFWQNISLPLHLEPWSRVCVQIMHDQNGW